MKRNLRSILCMCIALLMIVMSFASCDLVSVEESTEEATEGTQANNANTGKADGNTETKEEDQTKAETKATETIVETEEEKKDESWKVSTMSCNVYEYSDEVQIYIRLKNLLGYTVQSAMSVDVKMVDDYGNVVYEKTIRKKDTEDSITIKYDDVAVGTTNDGTLYYKVYNDYVSFDEFGEDLEKLPWTVDVQYPTTPIVVSYYSYNGKVDSSCKITSISYEVEYGDSLKIYFSGEKTYDSDGASQSNSCKIGWKLYDSEGYVVEDGTCYTTSIKTGEKFKNAEAYAFDVIEQGKSYRLEILNVN